MDYRQLNQHHITTFRLMPPQHLEITFHIRLFFFLPLPAPRHQHLLLQLPVERGRPPKSVSSTTKAPRAMGRGSLATLNHYSTPSLSTIPVAGPSAANEPFRNSLAVLPTASTPTPPNFQEKISDAESSFSIYNKYPLDPTSHEWKVLADLLHPIEALQIDQIVNMGLWNRFVSTRKDMLASKSDDLQLLTKLGVEEKQVLRNAQASFSYRKDPLISSSPYSDNMALLFHCTRNSKNIESILRQGLDERLGNSSGVQGLLGKGIYFADSAQKSIQYDDGSGIILVFAVLLGDCLSVDHLPCNSSFVREPEKTSNQRRNFQDLFFDSIVGRPKDYNEYVIYNRYQCCPLYQIRCNKHSSLQGLTQGEYFFARSFLPQIAWIPTGGNADAMPNPNHNWLFHAQTIFHLMGVPQEDNSEIEPFENPSENIIQEKINILSNVGLLPHDDIQTKKNMLKKFHYNVDALINHLLDSSTKISDLNKPELPEELANWALDFDVDFGVKEEFEECPICCEESSSWTSLKCSHRICQACYKKIETTRTTMGGLEHTSVKCPFCQGVSGVELGTCPNGKMTVSFLNHSCAGYEPFGTIAIKYSVQNPKYQLERVAYLPNNMEGNEVVSLLKIAWDRRLSFTIGTSVTTGAEDVLVWNIHHKTALTGGVQCHGYPDPEYLKRVTMELKSFGITK